MRIRMVGMACGPNGNKLPGQEYEVAPDEGAALCAGGYAVPVVVAEVERAVAEPAAEVRVEPVAAREAAPRKRKGRS